MGRAGLTLSLTARYFVLRDLQSLRDWSSMSCALRSSLCRALLWEGDACWCCLLGDRQWSAISRIRVGA